MSSAGRSSPAQISVADSTVAELANTASRRANTRSCGSSRSQLHSTTARRVRCRGNAERAPAASRRNRSSNRSTSWRRVIDRSRAAASSIGSGSPSSRRHTSATASTFSSVNRNPCDTAAARSAKSRTAGDWRISASSALSSGTPRDPIWHRASPGTTRASLLVASTRSRGHLASRSATRGATASTRCSQLSSTSNDGRLASTSTSSTMGCRHPACAGINAVLRTSRALTRASTNSAGSPTGASSTKTASPGSPWSSGPEEGAGVPIAPTSSVAIRVFPAPPGPTRVTSLDRSRSSRATSNSASRPTKLVTGTRGPPRDRRAGGSSGRVPAALDTSRSVSELGRSDRSRRRCRPRRAGEGSTPSSSARARRRRS